ncbi:MAG TPA: hypothetical protein VGJ16_01985 [Pirellulales bacterium]|jgi:hypothetical protein
MLLGACTAPDIDTAGAPTGVLLKPCAPPAVLGLDAGVLAAVEELAGWLFFKLSFCQTEDVAGLEQPLDKIVAQMTMTGPASKTRMASVPLIWHASGSCRRPIGAIEPNQKLK